jgi:DNA-binding CsgD family transcriptional regulator
MTEALAAYPEDYRPRLAAVPGQAEDKQGFTSITPESAGLSDIEIMVLEEASLGLSNTETGQLHFYCEAEIKRHRGNIFKKLGTVGINKSVNIALNTGILEFESQSQDFNLTPKELEILRASAWRLDIHEVCADLGITRGWVRGHKSNIINKIGARNMPHAIRVAYENGLFIHGPKTLQEHVKATLGKNEIQELENGSYGLSRSQSAKSRFVEEATVKFHRNNLFHKISAKNMPNAVALGFELGILSLDGADGSYYHLTPALYTQLVYAANGLTQPESAKKIGLSESTIGSRCHRIITELRAKNMPHAIRIAYVNGILPVGTVESEEAG